jgi:hypothetical protein
LSFQTGSKGKNNNFLSVRFQEDGQWKNEYSFCQYTFTGEGDLVLWLPNPPAFEWAIKTNILQGRMSKNGSSIVVTNVPGALLDFINDPRRLDLFKYTDPTILRKVAGPNN